MGFFDWLLKRGPSDPRRTTTFAFRRKLTFWLLMNSESLPEARKFLEQNLDLLRPESEQLLTVVMQRLPKKNAASLIEMSKASKNILHQAATMGKTPQAVRDAYIDEFSALKVLDLPSWLSSINISMSFLISVASKRDDDINQLGFSNPEVTMMKSLQLDAISRVRNDKSLEREILADMQLFQGMLLMRENPVSVIEPLTEAARVFCPQRFPAKFAQIRKYLGLGYFQKMELTHDERSNDVLCATVCLEDALKYYKPETDIEEWDQLMRRLCACYATLGDYDRVRQLRNEILSRLSSLASPEYFQEVQISLKYMEEAMQEREFLEERIEFAFSDASTMIREELTGKRNKRLSELERMREQFARLCKNG